ncbi:hypothetical protein ABIB50_003952 [Mucilaginibacter sp. UYCu711]
MPVALVLIVLNYIVKRMGIIFLIIRNKNVSQSFFTIFDNIK